MKNRVLITGTKFHVDTENKVVVCELKVDMQMHKNPAYCVVSGNMWRRKLPYVSWDGQFTVRAKARCNASDTFDETVGKRIAESRAKAKMFKIASRVWATCREALTDMAGRCHVSSVACDHAEMVENNHVLELTR